VRNRLRLTIRMQEDTRIMATGGLIELNNMLLPSFLTIIRKILTAIYTYAHLTNEPFCPKIFIRRFLTLIL
jgi:hypothetical protein